MFYTAPFGTLSPSSSSAHAAASGIDIRLQIYNATNHSSVVKLYNCEFVPELYDYCFICYRAPEYFGCEFLELKKRLFGRTAKS